MGQWTCGSLQNPSDKVCLQWLEKQNHLGCQLWMHTSLSECQLFFFWLFTIKLVSLFPCILANGKTRHGCGGQSHASPGRRMSASCPQMIGWWQGHIVPPTCLLCSSSSTSLTGFLLEFLLCLLGTEWPSCVCAPAFLLSSTFLPVSLGTSTYILSFLALSQRKGRGWGGASEGETQFGINPRREWVPQISSVPASCPPVSLICQKSEGPAP